MGNKIFDRWKTKLTYYSTTMAFTMVCYLWSYRIAWNRDLLGKAGDPDFTAPYRRWLEVMRGWGCSRGLMRRLRWSWTLTRWEGRTLISMCYALVIPGTQTEKWLKMDHFELLKITEGKNRKQSLVFHIVDHKKEKHYELLIDHVCQNTFTLR